MAPGKLKSRRRPCLSAEQLERARDDPFGPQTLHEDFIVCLECGQIWQSLGKHINKVHGMTADEYKDVWGYNRKQALMAGILLRHFSETSTDLRLADNLMPYAKRKGKDRPFLPTGPESVRQQGRLQQPGRRGDVTPEVLVEARREGLTVQQMAVRFGVVPWTVHDRLKKAGPSRGWPSRPDISPQEAAEAHQAGLTQAKIAARFGFSVGLVRQRLYEAGFHNKQRPDVSAEAVAAAKAAGLSHAEMMEKFGCSRGVILLRLREARQRSRQDPEDTAG